METSIQKGETHFRGTISIRIDDEYIAGGDRAPVADNIPVSLNQLLAGVHSCVEGEQFYYQTSDGPTYIVLEPSNNSVTITHCKTRSCVEDTESRLDIEHQGTVIKDEFYFAIFSTIERFINRVHSLNRDLANSDIMKNLKYNLDEKKKQVDDPFI